MIKGEHTFAFSFQQRVIFFIIKARQYPKKSHRGQVSPHLPHTITDEALQRFELAEKHTNEEPIQYNRIS